MNSAPYSTKKRAYGPAQFRCRRSWMATASMPWQVLARGPAQPETDPSETEFFKTEDSQLLESLVRETGQNSLEARNPASTGPVRICFQLHELNNSETADVLAEYLSELRPHLAAVDMPIPDGRMRLLTIEDFQTTGLTGDTGDGSDPAVVEER